MTQIFSLFLIAASSFLMGSLSGSLLLGHLRGVDIRALGSGNAGSTNALRTQGLAFALGVMVIDVGKAALATALAWQIAPPLELVPITAAVVAAGAVVVGHVWPIFHQFRGGKGASTVVGALMVLWPQGALIGLLVWLPVLILGGWVSLATMCAAIAIFVASMFWAVPPPVSLYTGCAAVAMLWTHRSNVARLRTGTEHRFERVRLLRKRARS